MADKDFRWYGADSKKFLSKDYLLPKQSLTERIDIIARTAESILGIKGYAAKFTDYMQRGWISLSTPIWTNFGTDRGLPISCFSSLLEDSVDSILYSQAEVGMMTKYGGGTAGYFGNIRGRGSPIKGNGTSNGAVNFMQLFETTINVISQGSTRRGSFAAYLPIEHPDILEFLDIGSEGHPIQQLLTGVTVTNSFMEEMIAGDKNKRKVWAKVLDSRSRVGYPYIIFIDNANNRAPEVYKHSPDLKIHASNLCVSGLERVVSDRGIQTAEELYAQGGNLTLFDGSKPVKASPMQLIERNAHTWTIKTIDGREHTITNYHKVKTSKGMVAAEDLLIGDKLCFQKEEGLFGNRNCPQEAFLLGLYHGDGTQHKNSRFIDIWENDFDLTEEINNSIDYIYRKYGWNTYTVNVPNVGKYKRGVNTPTLLDVKTSTGNKIKKRRLQSTKLFQLGFIKGIIPEAIWCGTRETQSQYLRGLYFADGTVRLGLSAGNPLQLSLGNIDYKFLQQVQIILSNLGIVSKIHLLKKEGKALLSDGKGGSKEYNCKTCYRLIISNKSDALKFEKLTGFLTRKGVSIEDKPYRDNTKKYAEVSAIEYAGRQNVYCTTVDSEEHVWTCNSFITSNCTEIMLPSSPKESFVCDLASMNDLYFDEWKNTDVIETVTFLLDAVMTEFIEKARSIKFMERAVRFAERHRALGIGQLGYSSYLQSKMVPFESWDAKMLNIEIAKTIQEKAYEASKELANRFGEPFYLKGIGRRNTTLCAIAPTKSSAFILGQVSEGIEPIRSNYFIDDKAKGKFSVKNPQLKQLLEQKGHNNDSTWDSILSNRGSVQHLDILSKEEKDVFKTFAEISPKEIIIQAAARQNFIDQGQSLNLIIHPNTPTREINQLYIEAWQLGLKSLYYQYNVNAAQEYARSINDCVSCQA